MPRPLKPADAFVLEGESSGYYTGAGFSPEISEAAKYPSMEVAEIVGEDLMDEHEEHFEIYQVPA